MNQVISMAKPTIESIINQNFDDVHDILTRRGFKYYNINNKIKHEYYHHFYKNKLNIIIFKDQIDYNNIINEANIF